ncbi:DUF998 domain-containing protein [Aquimarina sp. 2201CG14-23]|nr:DUF998 domain-containing protein [Aquimarina sp. 2201CG14-23]MDH7445515.1 DUF998 domain-containing protein [Aquimarina sp. 2201CG14-23]
MTVSDRPKSGFVALALSLIGSIGIFLAGIYSCDVGCSPPEELATIEQKLHDSWSIIGLFALLFSIPFWSYHLRSFNQNRGHTWYSIATTIIGIFAMAMMIISLEDRSGTGMYQRIFVGNLWLWVGVFAWKSWQDKFQKKI